MSAERIDTVIVAKIIRTALKAKFPTVKFTVKSSRYSGGSSIDCKWTDGPTEAQVKAIIGNYHGATFDGMIDLKEYHTSELNGQAVRFGNDFLFTDRSYSPAFLRQMVTAASAKYGLPAVTVLVSEYDGAGYINDEGEPLPNGGCYWTMRSITMRQAQETPA